MTFVVDGQAVPKLLEEPKLELNLKMPFVGVTAHEIPLEVWREANGWIETERQELR